MCLRKDNSIGELGNLNKKILRDYTSNLNCQPYVYLPCPPFFLEPN